MDAALSLTSDIFRSIPGEVWGAAIALCSVWISSKTNKTRLMMEIEANAEESEKQRKSDLRKEIYLEAAESLSRLIAHFSKLPSIDPANYENDSPDEMLRFSGLSAKVRLIAEPNTSKLAGKVLTKYAGLHLQAIQMIFPLRDTISEKEETDHARESIADALEKTMAQIDALTRAGNESYSVFEPLTRDIDRLVEESNQLKAKSNDLNKQQIRQQHDYMRWLIERLKELDGVTIDLFVALRQELDIEGDAEEFRAISEQNNKELQTEFERLLEHVNSKIEENEQNHSS